jgi:hypothetical protein
VVIPLYPTNQRVNGGKNTNMSKLKNTHSILKRKRIRKYKKINYKNKNRKFSKKKLTNDFGTDLSYVL